MLRRMPLDKFIYEPGLFLGGGPGKSEVFLADRDLDRAGNITPSPAASSCISEKNRERRCEKRDGERFHGISLRWLPTAIVGRGAVALHPVVV
jgi:hypothetical protein